LPGGGAERGLDIERGRFRFAASTSVTTVVMVRTSRVVGKQHGVTVLRESGASSLPLALDGPKHKSLAIRNKT
jgi:hypothetical protein